MRPLAPPFQSQNHEGGETAVAARLFAACHGPDGELREQFWNRVRDECEPLEFVLRSAALAFPGLKPGPTPNPYLPTPDSSSTTPTV